MLLRAKRGYIVGHMSSRHEQQGMAVMLHGCWCRKMMGEIGRIDDEMGDFGRLYPLLTCLRRRWGEGVAFMECNTFFCRKATTCGGMQHPPWRQNA